MLLVLLGVSQAAQSAAKLPARVIYDANTHPKFIRELPIPTTIAPAAGKKLSISITNHAHDWGLLYTDNTPAGSATPMWAFADQYPGPSISVERGVPLDVQWSTNIAGTHILSDAFDTSIHCGGNTANCLSLGGNAARFAIHLHGSSSRAESDGMPGAWFTKNYQEVGPTWSTRVLNYPNNINSTLLWYHDHAAGLTRLNHYAGVAGLYFIRDSYERSLVNSGVIPAVDYELPLIIEDRNFQPNGAMLYDCQRFQDGTPSMLPEFFGEYLAVNGVVWPKATVTARRYRLRILNNADSRFFDLSFTRASGEKVPFFLVGGDHGFVPTVSTLSNLVVAPGERADVVVDFSTVAGETVTLTNGAPSPYPGGAVPTASTSRLLQFVVGGAVSVTSGRALNGAILSTIAPLQTTIVRQLGLFETVDRFGRIFPLLGTLRDGPLRFTDPVTEVVRAGVAEEWEIYNFSPDAHPVHLHFTRFQVIKRRSFRATSNRSSPVIGGQLAPIAGDNGLKDTVKVLPSTVVTIRVQFDIPGDYMWHCHIFAHEDNEMMRPIQVLP